MQNRLAIAALIAPLAAAYTVTVTSHCPFSVYGWNVLESYGQDAPLFTLGPGAQSTWSTPFEDRTDNGGGASIKLKKTNNLFDGGDVNQIEYKMAGSTLFYDVSNINGNCFVGHEVQMTTSKANCPNVVCPANTAKCEQAYNLPDDLRTLACPGGADIEVVLCAGGSSQQAAAPSPAAPASTPAPVAPKPAVPTTLIPTPSTTAASDANKKGGNFLQEGADGDVEVVYETEMVAVTMTTTIVASPTDAAEKRNSHLKAHAARGRGRVANRHAHAHMH